MCRDRNREPEQAAEEFTLPDGMPYTLTMQQTARILKCGINGCYEAARRGEIPTVRIGRRLVVPTAALMAMLGAQSVACGAGEGDE